MISNSLIHEIFGINCPKFNVGSLGVSTTFSEEGVLTFLTDSKYVSELNENQSIKVVFVRDNEDSLIRSDVVRIYVDDPKWHFFTLVNYFANNKKREPTSISERAKVHPTAYIDPFGVVIEDGVIIEPNVTVLADSILKENVVVRSGAVVGVDGFEHKKTSHGFLSVIHDGKLIVEKNAEIGPNNTIIKGFGYRDTIIGEGTKLDALVHYAHGVQSGSNCLIAARVMIAGHVSFGNDVWVGPGSSISNRLTIGDNAFVTIGSVVVKNVAAGSRVTGNFAIPHNKFIRNLKAGIQ